MTAQEYYQFNNTCKKKFTFRLGYEAGFFSEFNNMVFAILYCLKNGYHFNLSSNNSNISKCGWSDFFLPFCNQTTSLFHQSFNFRGHYQPTKKEKLACFLYRNITGNLLTQDGWNHFHSRDFENVTLDIPGLNIHSSLLAASKNIIDIVWRFNPETNKEVLKKIEQVKMSYRPFAGLHIRRGDKISEIENNSVEQYMEVLKKNTDLKDIFVATDDYTAFVSLKSKFSDYNFFTLSTEKSEGFDYQKYNATDEIIKRNKLIDLFADIEMLSKAEIFVGTFSSNIGMYMGMRKAGEKVFGVDFEKWMIW